MGGQILYNSNTKTKEQKMRQVNPHSLAKELD